MLTLKHTKKHKQKNLSITTRR